MNWLKNIPPWKNMWALFSNNLLMEKKKKSPEIQSKRLNLQIKFLGIYVKTLGCLVTGWNEWKLKSLSRVWLSETHGLYSPWNSPGQSTGVGSLSLLQGIFPTQESNPGQCTNWAMREASE